MIKNIAAVAAVATGALLTQNWAEAAELTFWSWRQEDKAAYEELIADFNKLNPDTTVKFETFEPQNYQTVLSTALAAGKEIGRASCRERV